MNPVSRSLRAAAAAALALGAFAPLPSFGHDTPHSLTPPGTIGVIRVAPVMRLLTGAIAPVGGDPRVPASDPNRTVGDAPPPPAGPGCADVPAPRECFRSLGVNDRRLNPSAADGHTHYHAGDTVLVVDEIKGFELGDAIVIGSPYCNAEWLGETCRRYAPGQGFVSEQPTGETAVVVGGDAGTGVEGPGILRLATGLARDHLEGEQVVKLATSFVGQQLLVSIPNAALLADSPDPVTVRAELIPPQGSNRKEHPRYALAVGPDRPAEFATVVTAPNGSASFWIPEEMTGTQTIGPTFDADTPDTWYTVVVTATDDAGRVVARGGARFKLNAAFFLAFARDSNSTVRPQGAVRLFGVLRDNTPAATNRATDAVLVEILVRRPDGSVKRLMTRSCHDSDPGPKDRCGGDEAGYSATHHGEFMVGYGGRKGTLLAHRPPIVGPLPSPLNRLHGNDDCSPQPGTCTDGYLTSGMDTFQPGTYHVTARVFRSQPPIEATLTFRVQ